MATPVSSLVPSPESSHLPSDWLLPDGKPTPWWFSKEGIIIKWTVLAVLLSLFLSWLVGGWIHARVRERKGLPLMGYHRCLVKRPKNAKSTVQDRADRLRRSRVHVADDLEAGYCAPPPPIYDPARPPVYEARIRQDEEKRADRVVSPQSDS